MHNNTTHTPNSNTLTHSAKRRTVFDYAETTMGTQIVGDAQLWWSMSVATVVCGGWSLWQIVSVILAGGVGKNGSTVAVSAPTETHTCLHIHTHTHTRTITKQSHTYISMMYSEIN